MKLQLINKIAINTTKNETIFLDKLYFSLIVMIF